MALTPTGFTLDKSYFDCVTCAGDTLIGYAAKLKWGPATTTYAARILKARGCPSRQSQSLSYGTVHEEPGAITWRNDALRVSGSWTGGQRLDQAVLFDGPHGGVEWHCLGANSAVSVCVDGGIMAGSGYVERLVMTVPPWRLPFDELRWGRYISDDRADYAVWIDLRGDFQRNWTWMNASTPVEGSVENARVRAGGMRLELEASESIRHENVATTILGRFRLLATFLPRRTRVIQESKNLSSCVFESAGSESRGFSVNEVVRWL
jgi:hypothetical protein